jgi:hypothetical protein
MQRILISLFAVFVSFGFAVHEAEAKRMGGSKSFGMQRSAPAKQDAAPTPQRQQQTTERAVDRRRRSAPGWVRSPVWPPASVSRRCFPIWAWARRWPAS